MRMRVTPRVNYTSREGCPVNRSARNYDVQWGPTVLLLPFSFLSHHQEGLTALMISSRSGRTDLTETLLSGDNISLDIQDVRENF